MSYLQVVRDVSVSMSYLQVARKTSSTATGSYGTVSWLIQDNSRRLVIMWSAPFNFNHYSNWLGVGLSVPGVTEHAPGDTWFDLMYYNDSSDHLKFERREYYADVRLVLYRYVRVCGGACTYLIYIIVHS